MFIQKIKSKYSIAKISRCNEQCKIDVRNKHNFVMLKGESLVQNQPEKMCDCIVFQDNKKIAIIELKTKSLDADKIIDKFTNSGKKSISIATFFDRANKFDLFFILLAKNYGRHAEYQVLHNRTIKIDGKSYKILLKTCGCALKDFVP